MGTSANSEPKTLRILLDTNVILDIMLRREPWLTQALPLIEAQQTGRVIGYLPASALTDIFYISRRIVGLARAFATLDRCIVDFELLLVDRAIIESARAMPGSDFEDNVSIACAQTARLDLIVTRDIEGFRNASIPSVQPGEITSYFANGN